MSRKISILFLLTVVSFGFLQSCKRTGCVDPVALNYDADAKEDDGSCTYLADNLSIQFNSVLGSEPFSYNTDVMTASGRKVRVTRAQMYMGGFMFTGADGTDTIPDSYLLVKPDKSEYLVGTLPLGTYSSFAFQVGVDSVANHTDPATWPSSSALSSNNPDHIHWGWNSGFIFVTIEGFVDTSAAMNGPTNAAFSFHVGTDIHLTDFEFDKNFESVADGVVIDMQIDWIQLFNGTNMTADFTTRSTDTFNNPQLATLVARNVDEAISLQ